MTRARVLSAGAFVLVLVGCAQIVGIRDIPQGDAGDASDAAALDADASPADGGAARCTGASVVLTTSVVLRSIAASGGFVYAGGPTGIVRCAASGTCVEPAPIVQAATGETLEGFSPTSSNLDYSVQSTSGPDAGSVHAADLDGTNDQALLVGQREPAGVATSDPDVFWVEGNAATTPSTVHCIYCNGPDAAWITQLSRTRAIVSDSTAVYALADDGSGQTAGIYACVLTAACGSSPQAITTGLDTATAAVGLASDDTYVYVAQPGAVERFDWSGTPSTVIADDVTALTVDPATGDFYCADTTGQILTTASDGSTIDIVLSTCDASVQVLGLAFDDANLYALVHVQGSWAVYAIPR